MKKEKIILLFIAILIGLLVALGIFFFFQYTKQVKPSEIKKITIQNPSPAVQSSVFLTIDQPNDESVADNRVIRISGKTVPNAKIVILTQGNEEAAIPTVDGSFSTDITVDTGENIIQIIAVAPNGEIVSTKRVVTYSNESF
jgi:hypothetical protein